MFESAGKGTIFLDEFGEMSSSTGSLITRASGTQLWRRVTRMRIGNKLSVTIVTATETPSPITSIKHPLL